MSLTSIMKNLFYFISLAAVVFLYSCGKSTETVVVQNRPDTFLERPDRSPGTPASDARTGESFIQLRLGESDVIETQDPLFAGNNSEFRIISLLYDGLTEIGENGEVLPALAQRWEISADSLQYTFHLRPGVHFHNSSRFSSGLGRPVSAADVKFSFERMARPEVPDNALRTFEIIRGLNTLAKELETVKNPANRIITEAEGIKIPNDSTVVFNLRQKSPGFLYDLAHPSASVYAPESLPESGPVMQEAGTGRFYFAKKEAGTYILALNKEYFKKPDGPDRLDIIPQPDETKLLKDFMDDKTDAVIEPGPESLKAAEEAAGLHSGEYTLTESPATAEYILFYNQKSEQDNAVNILVSKESELAGLIENTGKISLLPVQTEDNPDSGKQLKTAQTTNPFALYLVNKLAALFTEEGFVFSMNASYALTDDVTFTAGPAGNQEPFIKWEVPVHILAVPQLRGIDLGPKPWSIRFNNLQIPD